MSKTKDQITSMKAAVTAIMERIFNLDEHSLIPEIYGRQVTMRDPTHAARQAGMAERVLDYDAVLAEIQMYRTAFPDLKYTIDGMIAEGDTVACRWHVTGTHQAPLGALEAKGNPIELSAVSFCRFEANRIVEIWQLVDRDALHAQCTAD